MFSNFAAVLNVFTILILLFLNHEFSVTRDQNHIFFRRSLQLLVSQLLCFLFNQAKRMKSCISDSGTRTKYGTAGL